MELRFEGALTSRDAKQYIPHHFELPSGCTSLEIDFRFEPKGAQGISNWPTLTLFDPHGFRGAGHRGGQRHHVAIAATAATPGYLPGPLPAGEWTVEIDTHMIMPGAPVRYQLDVAASRLEARGLPPSVPPTGGEVWSSSPVEEPEGVLPAREVPGWYRGDLHTHTHHSDAAGFTVRDLAALAQAYGLDFVFVTDHNTISGQLAARQLRSDLPLVCDGMELTTFYGHALVLGASNWIDWRVAPGSGEMAAIADTAAGRGRLFVIAHPQADGDPDCTGCSWRFGEMMPANATAVEVWNGPWRGDSNNEFALLLYYDWLNQGHRLVATAGTDVHGPPPPDADVTPGFTVVQADDLSQRALLEGLRAGRAYLSSGPVLALRALGQQAEGAGAVKVWGMSDVVTCAARFSLTWSGCPQDAEVRVLVDGKTLLREPSGVAGDLQWMLAPTDGRWTAVEIRDAHDDLLALTNPIYLDPLEGRPVVGSADSWPHVVR